MYKTYVKSVNVARKIRITNSSCIWYEAITILEKTKFSLPTVPTAFRPT